jgi:ubiquinone biosynthesis accessory factor UbiK
MTPPPFIDELVKQLKTLLANNPAADIEKNLKALLQSGLAKMDLVTREEFDVQRAVLAKARMQLDALEAKIAELERQ